MKIVIGIPAFNEEENIAKIITNLKKITNSIIVCDDGSSDMTSDIVKELDVNLIQHKKNLGYGAAIKSIFEKAKEIDSDVLITFDADGQHRIEDIARVLDPIIKDKMDLVIGSRFLDKESKEMPNYRKVGIKIITKITNLSIKEKVTDSQSGFRAYSKNALEHITPSDEGMGISTEILIKASSMELKIVEVPITVNYDGDTSTHDPVSHGTSVILSTIKFTSIEHPLKFYGIPSIIFLVIGVIFTYFAIQFYVEIGRLNTNLTLIAAVTILIGVILLITSILLHTLVSVVREKR
jgi:glycosyltransferase involved in cell wall biosynthesis